MPSKIKLIVSLGNPEEEYKDTRHNIGFMFMDYLAEKLGANGFVFDKKYNSFVSKTKLKKASVILCKPQTYVNKSGEAIKKMTTGYKLPAVNLVVVHDDLDIPFGYTKLSFAKNSGGHKGIESIIKSLKTKKFHRIRIGLATKSLQKARQQSDKNRDIFVRKFVLSKFSKKESEEIKSIFKEVHNKLLVILGEQSSN